MQASSTTGSRVSWTLWEYHSTNSPTTCSSSRPRTRSRSPTRSPSIRFLDAYEWRSFFETCSFVEQILRQDPVGIYPRMDFKSRDRYRHALEGMARRCPL